MCSFCFDFFFSNFQESQQKQDLVYKLRHLYDAMKIHNWDLKITDWPPFLTSGYPQSRVPLRSGKAVYVRWGFEVGSNTCLATSWCTRKDLRDTSLYRYCCMVHKKRTLTEKELTLTEY